MSNWVVGDYKLNGKLYRNVVMKREVRCKRLGVTFYDYLTPDNQHGGYKKVKPLKIGRVFKTQLEARQRKSKLEGRA